jgi:NADPH-dependent 2,4-dienoyl-CoA reductase/sulfur reductase-like enzyme
MLAGSRAITMSIKAKTVPKTVRGNERSGCAMAATSGSRRVVIVGGGFAGLFAARALQRAPV